MQQHSKLHEVLMKCNRWQHLQQLQQFGAPGQQQHLKVLAYLQYSNDLAGSVFGQHCSMPDTAV